jgi:hypothetical protein
MIYYTYAFLRKDKTPYYIGKGKKGRIHSTHRKFKPPKDKSRIIFLKQNLTEEEAFRHEVYMIAVFGRKDLGTGILHNRTDGGEGPSGAVRSDETRKKMSEAKKNMSDETRKKMSEAKKGRIVSNETRKKLSEANAGKTYSKKYNYKIYSIKESKIYETNNLNAFCKEHSLNHSPLFKTINGIRKQHKGFVLVEKVKI